MDQNKKEITKYLNQSNAISQTFSKISSITSYRMIRCGLFLIAKNFVMEKYEKINLINPDNWNKIDWKDFCCEFSISEFCSLLKIEDGTYQRNQIKQSIKDALKESVYLSIVNEDTLIKTNEWYPWFVHAKYEYNPINNKEGKISLRFNPGVLGIALNHKQKYTNLELEILGGLSSVYALRLYELLKSYYNLKGKSYRINDKGEKEYLGCNTWKTEKFSINQIKELLDISPQKYKDRLDNLLNKAIKEPIKQIESVRLKYKNPLKIEIIEIRGGRGNGLKELQFICTEGGSLLLSNNDTQKEKLNKIESNDNEKEILYYKEKYKDSWQKICDIVYEKDMATNNFARALSNYKESIGFEASVITYIKENLEK